MAPSGKVCLKEGQEHQLDQALHPDLVRPTDKGLHPDQVLPTDLVKEDKTGKLGLKEDRVLLKEGKEVLRVDKEPLRVDKEVLKEDKAFQMA